MKILTQVTADGEPVQDMLTVEMVAGLRAAAVADDKNRNRYNELAEMLESGILQLNQPPGDGGAIVWFANWEWDQMCILLARFSSTMEEAEDNSSHATTVLDAVIGRAWEGGE